MDFYESYYARYMAAPPELRKAARDHWTKCHKKNLELKRDDLIIFSAKILAIIAMIDAETLDF